MSEFYVYVIFRRTGEPCYVGKGFRERWGDHRTNAKNPHLRSIYQLEGDLPIVKVREGLSETDAFEAEIALISAIGRRATGGPLVNMTDGGDGVRASHTEVTKRRIKATWSDQALREHLGEVQRQRQASRDEDTVYRHRKAIREAMLNPDVRTKMKLQATQRWADSEERKNHSDNQKIWLRTDEARRKMSDSARRRWADPEEKKRLVAAIEAGKKLSGAVEKMRVSQTGKKASPETRAKMSASRRGRKVTAETREKMSAAAKLRCTRQRSTQGNMPDA